MADSPSVDALDVLVLAHFVAVKGGWAMTGSCYVVDVAAGL